MPDKESVNAQALERIKWTALNGRTATERRKARDLYKDLTGKEPKRA